MSNVRGTSRRRATILAGLILLAGLSMSPAVEAGAPQGLVRIHNRTDRPVAVYVQNVDLVGNRSWRSIATVPATSFLDIPGVPAGALLGAQVERGGAQWPPFRVSYDERGIFEYRLAPR